MKNIAKSLVIIVAIAAVASFATYAVFSAQDSIDGNTLSTGTLAIEARGVVNKPIHVTNMKPGDSTTGTLDVFNKGSLDAEYFFYLNNAQENNGWDLYSALNIELRNNDANGNLIYQGPLSSIYGEANKKETSNFTDWSNLKPCIPGTAHADQLEPNRTWTGGWTQRLWQKLTLPTETGNGAQGKTLTFDEVIYATQCNGAF